MLFRSSRALSNVTRLLQLSDALVKARQGLVMIAALSKIPLERQKGYVPSEITGQLELVDLCFQYPDSRNPVFEALNVKISPGSITAVTGTNGSGKTTLARILTGLMNPIRGQILLDGVELFQIVPEWWRKQIMYLPQEPGFIDASIIENLTINAPLTPRERVLDLCSKVGLGNFLNNLESGLDEPVLAGGTNLPVGIRRRLALVRALTTEGKIVILDEPTESIDPDGCRAVSMVLNELIKNGHTLILMTNDPYILEVAHTTIDLDSKPIPSITTKTQVT